MPLPDQNSLYDYAFLQMQNRASVVKIEPSTISFRENTTSSTKNQNDDLLQKKAKNLSLFSRSSKCMTSDQNAGTSKKI